MGVRESATARLEQPSESGVGVLGERNQLTAFAVGQVALVVTVPAGRPPAPSSSVRRRSSSTSIAPTESAPSCWWSVKVWSRPWQRTRYEQPTQGTSPPPSWRQNRPDHSSSWSPPSSASRAGGRDRTCHPAGLDMNPSPGPTQHNSPHLTPSCATDMTHGTVLKVKSPGSGAFCHWRAFLIRMRPVVQAHLGPQFIQLTPDCGTPSVCAIVEHRDHVHADVSPITAMMVNLVVSPVVWPWFIESSEGQDGCLGRGRI